MVEHADITLIDEPDGERSADALWHMSRYRDSLSQAQRLSAMEAVRRMYVDPEEIALEIHQEMTHFLDNEVNVRDVAALVILRNPQPILD
jgi:hypothetical protein